MNDMSSVIVPKSDQINADDLIGGDMTITIREVKITGGQEQPVSIFFDGSDKAFRPCKSMSRVLVAAWGPDAKAYVGRTLQLYRDPTVKWGGMEVGGIRIRAMTDIPREMTMALTATKGSRKPYTVKPLKAKASGTARDFLAEIAACPDRSKLRAWWSANNEAIPEPDYERVLGAFNERLNAVPKTAPAATAPQEEGGAADSSSQPADEGPDDSQSGEYDAQREITDRLIADKRVGAGRSAAEQREYESLPDDMRAEVDEA